MARRAIKQVVTVFKLRMDRRVLELSVRKEHRNGDKPTSAARFFYFFIQTFSVPGPNLPVSRLTGPLRKSVLESALPMAGRDQSALRKLVWICLGVFSSSFVLMMVFFYPFKHPLQQELGRSAVVIEPILFLQPFLGIWMLYQAIRYEAKPLRYVLLIAFVPLAYVWYYVERYRPRKLSA